MNSAKKRAILLMVSGATIGVLAVGVYFLQDDRTPLATDAPPAATSTPSIFDMEPIVPEAKVSTEGWKTCRNEEYGYEFQFPGEWKIYGKDALGEPNLLGKRAFVRESEECNGASVFLSTVIPWSGAIGTTSDVSLNIEVRPLDLSSNEFLHKYISTQDARKLTIQLLALDNHTSILQVYSHTSIYDEKVWGVQLVVNRQKYWLHGNHHSTYKDVIDTILSTFRFLDTATEPTPST